MCKSEIFETVLAAVAKETEIPIEKIVGGVKRARRWMRGIWSSIILNTRGFTNPTSPACSA